MSYLNQINVPIYFYMDASMINIDDSLIIGMFFGLVGFAYFTYGKKQKNTVALISGIVLIAFPYVISNLIVVVFIGIGLASLPFFLKY